MNKIKAKLYERTDEKQAYRSDYYPRNLVTRVGTLTLKVPRFRNGKLTPHIFHRYQRSEQALLLGLMEMWLTGYLSGKLKKSTISEQHGIQGSLEKKASLYHS